MESMVLRKKIVSIPQIDVPFAQYAKVITFDFANVPCDGMVFKGRSDRSGWQANSVEDKPWMRRNELQHCRGKCTGLCQFVGVLRLSIIGDMCRWRQLCFGRVQSREHFSASMASVTISAPSASSG